MTSVENLLSGKTAGFGDEYFKITEGGDSAAVCEDDKSFLEAYKSVLNSKATEESLVTKDPISVSPLTPTLLEKL